MKKPTLERPTLRRPTLTRPTLRRLVVLVAATAMLAAACSSTTIDTPESPNAPGSPDPPAKPVVLTPKPGVATELTAFDRCDELLDWVVGHAVDLVGPYGFEGGYGYFEPWLAVAEDSAGLSESATTVPAAASPASGREFTSTNVQEAGVDEPDLIKTDGERIVVIAGQQLHVIIIDGDGELKLTGSIDLDIWSDSMFLVGDVVTLVANEWGPVPFFAEESVGGVIAPYPQQPIVTLTEIDISDPSDPDMTRTLQIDGRYVSSRLVDGEVRVVVSAGPTGFAWSYPEGSGLRAEREAEQKNRQLVLDSTIDNWVPYYVLTDTSGRDRVVSEGALVECGRVHHPEEFSGLTTLSLVTLTEQGLEIADATSVFADGDIVYASTEAAYVATTRWFDPSQRDGEFAGVTTKIHRFELHAGGAAYTGSGAVDGFMMNQWSMSEYDGHLRVATTSEPDWRWGEDTESSVTILGIDGGALLEVGSVGGLGEGERIYSIRFMGDVGYVVTFRQVDPLYVIDLSDPARPTVEGELKISGYSAYLHPISDGILLGVGQDADGDGRIQGTQISLFDVTDPTDPDRIDRLTLTDSHSEVEWDHHAFLYHAESGTVVVPVERWWQGDRKHDEVWGGAALVLAVDTDSIRERGDIRHGDGGEDWYPQIRRSMVIGDALVTVSEFGVMSSDLDTLDEIDFVKLG